MKTKSISKAGLIMLLVFAFISNSNAQKPDSQKKPPKVRNNAKTVQKSVMNDLPTFFVDDSEISKELKKVYVRDASRISIRLINKEVRLSQQTVKIPEELVQSVYNAMVAVRKSNYAVIDTITKHYYIRTFPVPNVENIILVADYDAPWLDPLKRREDTTGNVRINTIMREHNLAPTKIAYIDEERVALVMQSREPLNIPALTMQFFTNEGIGSIEEVLPYGDGNDISIERTKDGWEIKYSLKFGDCSYQCQKYHDWSFAVAESGEVSYLGSSGHAIPPWIKSGRTKAEAEDVLSRK